MIVLTVAFAGHIMPSQGRFFIYIPAFVLSCIALSSQNYMFLKKSVVAVKGKGEKTRSYLS